MRRGALTFLALLGLSLLSLLTARAPLSQAQAKFVGDEACAECHEAEFKAHRAGGHGRAANGKSALGQDISCESCHGAGSLHVEADNDRDHPGFDTMTKFAKLPVEEANTACLSCHRLGEQFHWPQSSHARKNVACIECHTMHAAKDPGGLKLLKAESPSKQCLTCHRSKHFSLSKSAHMPLTEGGMECTDCHNPHGTAGPHQIRAASNTELCTKCHADKRGPMLWEHPPVRENCVTCHEPHGANNDKVLTARKPLLCQRCHVATRHPSTLYDGPDLASNRLFNRSCTNCHSQVHGSNHPSGKTFLR